MHLTELGKRSFRSLDYFQAEIKIDYFKFKTSFIVINDNSTNFDFWYWYTFVYFIIGSDIP